MNANWALGIDLGGTKTEIVAIGQKPLQVLERQRIPTNQAGGYGAILDDLVRLVEDFRRLAPGPVSIGMGIPGTLDPQSGLVKNANSQCLIGHPLGADLAQRLGQEVALANDANLFAWAEAVEGAGQGQDLVLGIILGTGMGGGIAVQGKIHQGVHGIAGEWGHSTIDLQGRPCWCGRRGCLEQYLSGPAVEAHYRQLAGRAASLAEIDHLALAGEAAAMLVMGEFLQVYGEALANLINIFDPDCIVLGGGVSNLPRLYNEGRAEVAKRVFDGELTTPILQNQLGDSAGVYGAAWLGREFCNRA